MGGASNRHCNCAIQVTFYPNEKRQQTYLIISNNSDRRVMFKMKSTRPGVYKMKPVHGVINPTEKYSIRIAYMGIKVGHRIPVNDRITVVLASVSNKGEGDKKDVVEGEMRKRKLNILFKGVNDQEAEQEGEGDGQKVKIARKLSAEKPVDRKTYMNGYDEGYKAALIEGKEPAFQEGFTEGYKKATAMLKTTGSKEANQPSKELAKAPSKEPAKAPSKEIVKAPSKEIAVLSKERLKGGPRTKSKEKVKPSKERVKALSKEKAVPLKKVAKPPSKEPVKTASKEVVKAPSKETAKPLPVEQVKAVKKVKAPSKEAAEEPSKEIVKQPSKEPAKPPPKEPKQVVIVMYRDPQAAENLLSRSGDEDDDDDNMPSEPSQPPIPPQEPQ
ncbi:MSP domain protein [Ancylostoma ceylanicum]|uniref:Major sperm protein n=1 Tax=Ancylostoma ceylanicum TaxID=53326 RepID=A0A0D6LKG9_9BILA|nr:MSP domain protein [Ancylostoma ceylanicum]